jgi:hypothetical protein
MLVHRKRQQQRLQQMHQPPKSRMLRFLHAVPLMIAMLPLQQLLQAVIPRCSRSAQVVLAKDCKAPQVQAQVRL